MTADGQRIMAALDALRAELVGMGGELDGVRGDLRRVSALVDQLPTKAWCRRVSIFTAFYVPACVAIVWGLALASFIG